MARTRTGIWAFLDLPAVCIVITLVKYSTCNGIHVHDFGLFTRAPYYGTPFATKIPPRVCVYKIDSLNDFTIDCVTIVLTIEKSIF